MSREAPKIGLDNVYIAKVISDTADGIVYETPIPLKGAVNISINPNSSVDVDYADNGAFVSMNNRGVVDATLEMIDVDNAIIAQMLGQRYTRGVITEGSLDQSPYFAMMFRVLVASSGSTPVYHLFCYAKGRFSVPETTADTKKDTIDFGHITLNAQFINTNYDNKLICSHCRTDDPATQSDIVNSWFNNPILLPTQFQGVVTPSLVEGSTSSTAIVKFTAAVSVTFNLLSTTVLRNNTVCCFDASGNAVLFNVTLLDETPVAEPRLQISKFASAEPIKTIVITAGLKTTIGGSAVNTVLTIA